MASRQFLSLASLRTVVAALAMAMFAAVAQATVVDADPSNYLGLLSSLAAGDTLRLASGAYSQGLALGGKAGTASQPIIVVGPDDRSAVFTARDCCSTVQLEDTSYVQIANLTLDGGGRSGSSGLSSRGNSHHITLENLKIIGRAGDPKAVGISTQGPAWDWIIRHNTVIGGETGLALGAADGTQSFVAGLIEYNMVLDTAGSNLEIARQFARPAGMGVAVADSRTIIRHNVFNRRVSAAVGGEGAQPNVRLGKFPLSGVGANDFYELYGNFFSQSPTEALVRAEGKLVAHDNLFVNAAGEVVSVEPSDSASRDIRVAAVSAAATPTVTLSASPASVAVGGTSQLSWASTDTAGCSASGGWSGTKAPSGSETVGPLQSTMSFQLTCLGAGGNASAITQVTVGGGPAPPTTPPPSTPPPSTPPPTTPPPSTPPSMDTGQMKSGGGGGFDALALAFLAVIAGLRIERARLGRRGATGV